MTDQFLGEIRTVGFNFPPNGWAFCNGQILPIAQNTALFSLLGNFYGGDGRSTFALPNLQGLTPINQGNGAGLSPRSLGQTGGVAGVSLTVSQIPPHTHGMVGSATAGTTGQPAGDNFAEPRGLVYGASSGSVMSGAALSVTGGGLPHNNMAPYLALNFVIALVGIYPSRG